MYYQTVLLFPSGLHINIQAADLLNYKDVDFGFLVVVFLASLLLFCLSTALVNFKRTKLNAFKSVHLIQM